MFKCSRIITLSFFVAACLFALALSGGTAEYNDGVHLAVSPICVKAKNDVAGDLNYGLSALHKFKTIVVFGDSFTDAGTAAHDGSPPAPPVLEGTSPRASGRVTNGYTWVEDLAADVNATIIDYAIGGAVVNVTLWPGRPQASDFVQQTNLFLSQNRVLDPKTTLYAAFFGINDYASSLRDGNQMPQAAVTYLALVDQLMASPTKAKYWLTVDDYGRGLVAETGDVYKNAIFAGLSRKKKLKYGFVDLYNLWNGVLGTSPGFAAFGYSSPGACTLSVNSSVGACSDPDHTFYWQPGHPSKQTHRIMADYVQQVLKEC